MKVSTSSATYNTDTSDLVKKNFEIEDLGSGWSRLIERNLYYRPRAKDYFLYVKKSTIDERCMVVDCQEVIYKVLNTTFVRSFKKGTNEIEKFSDLKEV